MPVQQLARDQWPDWFDALARTVAGARAEVASCDVGEQRLAAGVPLLGLSYDPRAGMLTVALEGVDHRIARLAAVYVDILPNGLTALDIQGEDGVRTIIELAAPLLLAEPVHPADA